MASRKLSQALVEELGDTRLLLETAAHNVNVTIRQTGPEDSLASALAMVEQAVATLRRIKQAQG